MQASRDWIAECSVLGRFSINALLVHFGACSGDAFVVPRAGKAYDAATQRSKSEIPGYSREEEVFYGRKGKYRVCEATDCCFERARSRWIRESNRRFVRGPIRNCTGSHTRTRRRTSAPGNPFQGLPRSAHRD